MHFAFINTYEYSKHIKANYKNIIRGDTNLLVSAMLLQFPKYIEENIIASRSGGIDNNMIYIDKSEM